MQEPPKFEPPKFNKDDKNKKKPNFPKMKKSQTITFWIVVLLMIIVFFQFSKMNTQKYQVIAYSDFEVMYKNKEVIQADINGKDVVFSGTDGTKFAT